MLIMIIMGVIALPFFILGLFIRKGKGLMLLAGYNTMPKAKRDTIDKKVLSRTAGNLLLRMSLVFVLLGISIHFELTWVTIALFVLLFADPCVAAVRMSGKIPKHKTSRSSKIVVVAITALVVFTIGVIFYYGESEPKVSIVNNHIEIKAMYGVDTSFSEVLGISLIEKSMKDIGIGRRSNGYGGFGDTLKGHFEADNHGDILLFVRSEASPTICIERKEAKNIYINYNDEEKTRALYQQMIKAVPLR